MCESLITSGAGITGFQSSQTSHWLDSHCLAFSNCPMIEDDAGSTFGSGTRLVKYPDALSFEANKSLIRIHPHPFFSPQSNVEKQACPF